MCRGAFPFVVELTNQVCEVLSSLGPETFVDIDNLLQRESLDIIGRVGFATDMKAIRGFNAQVGSKAAGLLAGDCCDDGMCCHE